jgi:hypothetical protein
MSPVFVELWWDERFQLMMLRGLSVCRVSSHEFQGVEFPPKLSSSSTENTALPLVALKAARVSMFKVCTSNRQARDRPLKPERGE